MFIFKKRCILAFILKCTIYICTKHIWRIKINTNFHKDQCMKSFITMRSKGSGAALLSEKVSNQEKNKHFGSVCYESLFLCCCCLWQSCSTCVNMSNTVYFQCVNTFLFLIQFMKKWQKLCHVCGECCFIFMCGNELL